MRALLLALPMLLAAPAPAADPVPGFPALRAELEIRRDAGLAPAPARAVRRALSMLDARADSLIARLGVAVRVGTLLERAFPDEFPADGAPAAFGTLMAADLEPMGQGVLKEWSRMLRREEWLSERGLVRINRIFEAALRRYSRAGAEDPVGRARDLLIEAKSLARRHAVADRDPGDGLLRKRIKCDFQLEEQTVAFEALHPAVSFTESDQGIRLSGSWSEEWGTWSLDLTVRGVGENGVYYPPEPDMEGFVLFETPGRLPVRYRILPTGPDDDFTVWNFDRFHGVSGWFRFQAVDGEGNSLLLRGGRFAFSASEIEFLP